MGLKKAEKEKQGQQFQHVNSPFVFSLNPITGPTSNFSFQTLAPRPVTWNNHAPNIVTPLPNMPRIENPTNAPGFLADSHNMLWQVVASQQLPVHYKSMNPLLINQNYSLQNMQHGSNDISTLNNNLMGSRSSTSQHLPLDSNNRGFKNYNYNGLVGSGFVQNSYSQARVETDRTESPSSNLTCGNSEAILNPNSWDLDRQV
jgi:hypothetical protein